MKEIVGTVDVPLENLPALNKSQDHTWFYSDKGGVLAGLEVFHSIHCLDMIRQYTYKGEYDYSDNPTFQDDDEFLRIVSCSKHSRRIFIDMHRSMLTTALMPCAFASCAMQM
jgi:hypothetical protein